MNVNVFALLEGTPQPYFLGGVVVVLVVVLVTDRVLVWKWSR